MRPKYVLAVCLLILSCHALIAQTRMVKGMVTDSDGLPLAGVSVEAKTGESTISGEDGKFSFAVSWHCSSVSFSLPHYLPVEKDVDGSFMLVRMKYYKNAQKLKSREQDKDYDEIYKNRGFEHSVELSYAYQIKTEDVTYRYSGYRDYGSTNPVELDYSIAYKFNRRLSVGIGAGVLWHLSSLSIDGDELPYEDFSETRADIPVFVNIKYRMLRKSFRPFVALQGGYYCLSRTVYGEAGLGGEARLGKRTALQLTISLRTSPWPHFYEYEFPVAAGGASVVHDYEGYAKYEPAIAPCIKIGFSF